MNLPMPFDISPRALAEVQAIMARKQVPEGYALRVGIRGTAGCAGVSYLIGFDKPQDSDTVYDIDGLPIVMERRQALYLAGVTVDWVERDTERGFAFVKN